VPYWRLDACLAARLTARLDARTARSTCGFAKAELIAPKLFITIEVKILQNLTDIARGD